MFYERLKIACAKAGISPTALLREFNMDTSNTGRWKHGGKPRAALLTSIAKRLNVSTDYLLGNTDDPTPPGAKKSPSQISDRERRWLDLLRLLPDKDLDAVMALIETLGEKSKQ